MWAAPPKCVIKQGQIIPSVFESSKHWTGSILASRAVSMLDLIIGWPQVQQSEQLVYHICQRVHTERLSGWAWLIDSHVSQI